MLNGHFWYSEKQKKAMEKNRKLAMINGKEVEYTEMRTDGIKKPTGQWDDYVYLGFGHYLRIEKQ